MRCDLKVSFAGPMVSLQDAGRPGLMRFGVPQSGPMDRRSLAIANTALGNLPQATGIEISLGGLQLECVAGAVSFAVAGGGFQVRLADRSLGPWTVATITEGQRLTIRPGKWGSWAMLAFAGDLQGQSWLGSRATHSQSGLGGGLLQTGAVVTIANGDTRAAREGDLTPFDRPAPKAALRVVMGPQDRFFDAAPQDSFLGSPFTLTEAYDRMGVRLSGAKLPVNAALDMASEPILRGSVQVAGDGVATVLLADHQTTGGYPKIATLIAPDLDTLVQRRSGDTVTFVAISPEQAIRAARLAHDHLTAYLDDLAKPRASLAERLMQSNLISGVTSGE
ncbi:MAG: biotin-dependent carboxyltransferase family protein [bacterium]